MSKRLRSNFFVSVPKNFVGDHFDASNNFGYRKILCIRKGYHYFPSKFIFLSQSAEKIRRGALLCFEKIQVSKSFMHRRGWHHSFVDFFCLTVPKNFRGTLLCFRKFLVWKKIWIGGGGASQISGENFLSHSAKKIRGEPFNVSDNLGYRKTLYIIGGYHDFPSIFFLFFFDRKTSQGTLLCMTKFRVSRNFLHEGDITIFSQGVARFSIDYFMSQSTETFLGEPFSVSLISGVEKFHR